MEIEWSGYNGDGENLGHEYIKIKGETTCNLSYESLGVMILVMLRFTYEWGGDSNETATQTDENSSENKLTAVESATVDRHNTIEI